MKRGVCVAVILLALCACGFASGVRLSGKAHVRWHGAHQHTYEAEAAQAGSVALCTKETIFHIEDSEVSSTEDQDLGKDRMVAWIDERDKATHPHIRVKAIDLPCAAHGCCNHTFLVRPQGTDAAVLRDVWAEYRDFLDKLQPHVQLSSVLEGGGNIGVATVLFALMFPAARVVVLEPEPHNCLMLKANTLALPGVRVHCKGLWNRITQVAVRPAWDRSDWGWRIEEVPEGTSQAVQTTTPQALLEEHGLDGFDFVKIDIEGAEFTVFKEGEDLAWLDRTQLLAMEIHGTGVQPQLIEALLLARGFQRTTSGEYAVFAREAIHALLV